MSIKHISSQHHLCIDSIFLRKSLNIWLNLIWRNILRSLAETLPLVSRNQFVPCKSISLLLIDVSHHLIRNINKHLVTNIQM